MVCALSRTVIKHLDLFKDVLHIVIIDVGGMWWYFWPSKLKSAVLFFCCHIMDSKRIQYMYVYHCVYTPFTSTKQC